jgi:hypothetical protein
VEWFSLLCCLASSAAKCVSNETNVEQTNISVAAGNILLMLATYFKAVFGHIKEVAMGSTFDWDTENEVCVQNYGCDITWKAGTWNKMRGIIL